jgi:hypothetical protein
MTLLYALCFDYWGNFGHVIVNCHRVNWPRNVHLRASKMRLCGLNLEILYVRLKNKTHLSRISCVMHNYNNSHAQTVSVAGPKKIIMGFQTAQPKKKKLCARIFGV